MSDPKQSAWRCPKCGAEWYKCGQGECLDHADTVCEGLICECLEYFVVNGSEMENHGEVAENPCPHARCYHCGWRGTVPGEAQP